MTSVPSNIPFQIQNNYNESSTYPGPPVVYNSINPLTPGAFLINGGVAGGSGSYPIYCSINDYSAWGMNDIDDSYIVMPGFTLFVFTDIFYQGSVIILDNSYGINILNQATTNLNQGSSCILQYNGNGYLFGNYVNNSIIFINNISGSLTTLPGFDLSGTMIPNNLPFQILNNNQNTSLVTSSYSPGIPGAYLMNGYTTGVGSFPIFFSINYSTYGIGGTDDFYLIMPGYSIDVYNINGNEITFSYNNNTTNIVYKEVTNKNSGYSCVLNYTGSFIYSNSIPTNLPMQVSEPTSTGSGISNINPATPGAYLFNGVNPGYGSFPIFSSITNYITSGMNDIDDNYLVMPGYKIIVYTNGAYEGNSTTIDNTASSSILFQATSNVNQGSSCKLYYNGVEIVISGFS
jgi:hypothetical protein